MSPVKCFLAAGRLSEALADQITSEEKALQEGKPKEALWNMKFLMG
jgi:hypothetical protein